MKRVVAGMILVGLLCWAALPIASANMVDAPPILDSPKYVRAEWQSDPYPTYAIAAGVVGVALTSSLIVLRKIRRRSGQ